MRLSRDGTRVYSGSRDATVREWDAASGALRHTFEHAADWVNDVVVAEDIEVLFTASSDTLVTLWPLKTPGLLPTNYSEVNK